MVIECERDEDVQFILEQAASSTERMDGVWMASTKESISQETTTCSDLHFEMHGVSVHPQTSSHSGAVGYVFIDDFEYAVFGCKGVAI